MDQIHKTCCFTGNRPHKMDILNDPQCVAYIRLEQVLFNEVFNLALDDVDTFYTGCARGFDLLAAEAVIRYNAMYPDEAVILACAIPYPGHDAKWPDTDRHRLDRILGNAMLVKIVSGAYSANCFQKRNEFMVDHSHYVVSGWNGERRGGAFNTMTYAYKQNRMLHIIKPYQSEYSIVPPKSQREHPVPVDDDYEGKRDYARWILHDRIMESLAYENNWILRYGINTAYMNAIKSHTADSVYTALMDLNHATDKAMLDKIFNLPKCAEELSKVEQDIDALLEIIHGSATEFDNAAAVNALQELMDKRNAIMKLLY